MTKSQLRACPSCARHVRVSEASCPFCGGALGAAFQTPRAQQAPAARLTRAALFAFGTGAMAVGSGTAVVAETGCSSSSTPAGDAGQATPVYGGPAVEDSGADGGQIVAAYGGPPIGADAGSGDAGGIAPVYGAPPSSDGGL